MLMTTETKIVKSLTVRLGRGRRTRALPASSGCLTNLTGDRTSTIAHRQSPRDSRVTRLATNFQYMFLYFC